MRHFALAILLPLAGCAARQPAPTILTIDAAPQQTIRCWGIYPCKIQNDRPKA